MSGGGHGHGGKRRGHEEEHEEHENHERWLVSYADMMTLLMVLFIVMFAISQVDTKKFAALKTGLSTGFGAPVAMLSGGDAMLEVGGSVAPDSVNLAGSDGTTRNVQGTLQDPIRPEVVAELAKATEQAQVAEEAKNLQEAKEKLEAALAAAGMKKAATFRFDERGLVVSIATDKVLFPSGNAQLQPSGRSILDAVAPTIRDMPNRISVDGHTNRIPINTAQFPSNWELSTARATGVLRHLHTQDRIPYSRMTATGYADTMPLLPYTNPRANVANRRVEIVILAAVDNAAGRAVEELANEKSSTTGGSSGSTARSGPLGAGPLNADPTGPSPADQTEAMDSFTQGAKNAAKQLSR